MGPSVQRFLFLIAASVAFAGSGYGSPLNSKLLALVPPGAEVVSGFENHSDPHRHGHLLLTPHSNRLDLEDWQALTGIDNQRRFDEIVEVAAAPFGGNLSEHLLLVSGRFDQERIFKAAQLNGARINEWEGHKVLVVKPFAREQGDMLDTRWLAILDSQIGIFGTQWMVQVALRRHATHADFDMPLMERLRQLHRDVSSWNVLVTSPKDFSSYTVAQTNSPWARLMEGAEALIIGVRFGSKVRVEFSLRATSDHGQEFFTQKAASFAEVFATERALQEGSSWRRRLGNLMIEPNHVQASIEMSSRQFDDWIEQTNRNRFSQALPSRSVSRGE